MWCSFQRHYILQTSGSHHHHCEHFWRFWTAFPELRIVQYNKQLYMALLTYQPFNEVQVLNILVEFPFKLCQEPKHLKVVVIETRHPQGLMPRKLPHKILLHQMSQYPAKNIPTIFIVNKVNMINEPAHANLSADTFVNNGKSRALKCIHRYQHYTWTLRGHVQVH